MSDHDPNKAVNYIISNAPLLAQAKADRVFIENFLRSKKALLMKASGETAIAAQEREAYAHADYLALLEGLKEAVKREERLRWELTAAEARIQVWRSAEASNRLQDRATQ